MKKEINLRKKKVYKIVHTADVHLKKSNGKILRAHIFSKLVRFCINNKVNTLLISGDLFEEENREVMNFVKEEFRELYKANILVFIISGDHDQFITKKTFIKDLSENVHLFTENEKKDFQEISVYGIPYQSTFPKLEGFKARARSLLRIAMIHGSYMKGEKKENRIKNSFTRSDLMQSKFDYIALGHFHDHYRVGKNAYYCGSPVAELSYNQKRPSFILVRFQGKRINVKRILL